MVTELHSSSTYDFAGSTVVVTGASGGIGGAIAAQFAQAGAIVVSQGFTTLPTKCNNSNLCVQVDMRTYEGADLVAAAAIEHSGRIDVWINNAALQPIGAFLDLDPDQEAAVLDTNIGFVMRGTRAAAKAPHPEGLAIINISSIEGLAPAINHSHYGAAKAAIIAHTKAAAAELGPDIRVNAIAPGLIDRPGLDEAWPEGVSRWTERSPLHRLGSGADVAHAAMFLASSGASFITGAVLVVDGGMLARSPW
jgi:NAD(P)-dependent dehydrogenase (short-subunit alcohol dehydrogenase family)